VYNKRFGAPDGVFSKRFFMVVSVMQDFTQLAGFICASLSLIVDS
jgi:hypothetical protein